MVRHPRAPQKIAQDDNADPIFTFSPAPHVPGSIRPISYATEKTGIFDFFLACPARAPILTGFDSSELEMQLHTTMKGSFFWIAIVSLSTPAAFASSVGNGSALLEEPIVDLSSLEAPAGPSTKAKIGGNYKGIDVWVSNSRSGGVYKGMNIVNRNCGGQIQQKTKGRKVCSWFGLQSFFLGNVTATPYVLGNLTATRGNKKFKASYFAYFNGTRKNITGEVSRFIYHLNITMGQRDSIKQCIDPKRKIDGRKAVKKFGCRIDTDGDIDRSCVRVVKK